MIGYISSVHETFLPFVASLTACTKLWWDPAFHDKDAAGSWLYVVVFLHEVANGGAACSDNII